MKKSKVVLISVALICLLFALCACGSDDGTADKNLDSNGSSDQSSAALIDSTEPINCVILYGTHANSESNPSLAYGFIDNVIGGEGYLGVVRIDGDPRLIAEEQFELESKNHVRKDSEIAKLKNSVTSMLQSDHMIAEVNEVDLISAFDVANRCFSKCGEDRKKNVAVVVDPGFSTKGVLDFTNNEVFSADEQTVLDFAKKQGLPDLSNIDRVIWLGFGDVAAPQEKTNPLTINKMKQLYTKLLEEAGVAEGGVTFEDLIVSGVVNLPDDLPKVSVVAVPAIQSLSGETVVLAEDSSNIRFEKDASKYIDEASAKQDLEFYADALKQDSNLKVTVKGYTANQNTGHAGGHTGLSQDRAEAVKNTLIDLGVSESQITAEGCGIGKKQTDQENRCVELVFS